MVRRTTGVALLLAGLAACHSAEVHQAEFFVFGTLVDVKVRGVDTETAATAFNELQARFQSIHRDWHAWEPGLLHDVNVAFGEGDEVTATPELINLVHRSQQLEALSGGHFNAAMGGLIGLWGFHTSSFPVLGPPPDDELVQGWLRNHPSARDIVIEGDHMRTANPAVQLDFGGIAKGYAVDIAMQDLARHGIESAIVNAGGDLRARGWDGDPWRIGVQHPSGGVLGVIEVREDESVFTSGVNQRYRQDGSARYPHVLNPHTGYPVQGLQSVTVIAVEGVTADAAATALLVAGPEEWPQTASHLGIREVLVVDDQGALMLTPAMRRRVRLLGDYEDTASVVEEPVATAN